MAHSSHSAKLLRSLADVEQLLESRVDYEKNRGLGVARIWNLEPIQRYMDILGRPDRAFRSIHVTGTKGKSSVSRMLAALLQATGIRVGLYTSPHVEHIRERIVVNGIPVSEEALVDSVNMVKPFLDWFGLNLTHFELLTVAAFCVFRNAKVDVAVVEVGMGGRLDATNVIEPEVSVITNVDYDHMEVLGDTLEQIAFEKAGIIKPGIPVICGVSADGPQSVILSRAAELRAPVFLTGSDYTVNDFRRTGYRSFFNVRTGSREWGGLMLHCPAACMATNAAHALMAYQVLREKGVCQTLPEETIKRVLAAVELPACCEVFPGSPTILIDGAHNAMAAASLSTVVRSVFHDRDRVLVVGIPRDKEVEKIVAHFADAGARHVVFTRYAGPRAISPSDLVPMWRRRSSANAEVIEQPDQAYHRAITLASGQGMVIVTGSIHLAGELRPLARAMVSAEATTFCRDGIGVEYDQDRHLLARRSKKQRWINF